MVVRPDFSTVPDAPGVYLFHDAHRRPVYVGKAKSLRARLGTYFGAPGGIPERTRQMLEAADDVEWVEVRTEPDALLLENELIKRHQPRFNIRLKDDKSFPFLAVTLADEWPRAMVLRGKKRKGSRYFGPFAHAYAIRETLDLLLRTFPIRTCSDAKFRRHVAMGRPCLYAHIEKCAAPCVGAISKEDYDGLVEELLSFLEGDTDEVVARLEEEMHAAAEALEFERAARLRDQLDSMRRAVERQEIVGDRSESYDAIGIEDDPLEASVQVFSVRRGRMVGTKGLVVDKVEEIDLPGLVARLLGQLYGDDPEGIPKEVLVPVLPEDHAGHEQFLSDLRGSRVTVRVPQRGAKRRFHETVTVNAKEALVRHRLRRSSDHNARARALTALQDELGLPEAPLRIECFDISHLQGDEIVGSMVVMEDGLPKRPDYRHFKVRGLDGQDDYGAMEEVLTRRFRRYLEERDEGARAGKRFSYPPNLCVVDGGPGQLAVAEAVVEDLGLDEEVSLAALAKRFEEVYVPGRPDPLRIPRDSEALYLLQAVRDEAHRFAVRYHRKLRDRRMTRSELDDVPGLGPARRKRLLSEFGSVKRVRQVDLEELRGLSWLPDKVADALYDRLHGPPIAGGSRERR